MNIYLVEVIDLDDLDVVVVLNVLVECKIINFRKVVGFKLVSVNVSIDKWVFKKILKILFKKLGEII